MRTIVLGKITSVFHHEAERQTKPPNRKTKAVYYTLVLGCEAGPAVGGSTVASDVQEDVLLVDLLLRLIHRDPPSGLGGRTYCWWIYSLMYRLGRKDLLLVNLLSPQMNGKILLLGWQERPAGCESNVASEGPSCRNEESH